MKKTDLAHEVVLGILVSKCWQNSMLCLDGQLYKHIDTRFLTFSVIFCVFL